jgi:hypothetical protein
MFPISIKKWKIISVLYQFFSTWQEDAQRAKKDPRSKGVDLILAKHQRGLKRAQRDE